MRTIARPQTVPPLSFFEPVILRSFERGRMFMRVPHITRFLPDRAVELRNLRLLHLNATHAREITLDSMTELRLAIAEERRPRE